MSALDVFGVIVAGRAPQTKFQQLGEKEFVLEIPNAGSINHLVVFLTGTVLFPEHLGGSVYVQWPNTTGGENWHYLGFISNAKPSAIFKIAQLANHKSDNTNSMFATSSSVSAGNVMIGVMVESLQVIESKVGAEGTSASTQSTISQFADKMITNLVNYLNSYVVTIPDPNNPHTSAEYIPARAIQNWYQSFERRLHTNPNFWRFLQ